MIESVYFQYAILQQNYVLYVFINDECGNGEHLSLLRIVYDEEGAVE